MKRYLFITAATLILSGYISPMPNFSYAQEQTETEGPLLILREAQEKGKTTVAIEASLTENILEAKITSRMYGTKPKIYNTLIVGSKLGRLSLQAKEVLLASIEDEEPYPTTNKNRAFISFSAKTKTKTATGTLTRELVEFKIPRDKIRQKKPYQMWAQIESLQRGGKYETFKFALEDFFERLNEAASIASLKTIVTACEDFRSNQTPLVYPASLAELTSSESPYIDTELANTTSADTAIDNYYYTYVKVNNDQFTCTATPALNDEEVYRTFIIDETGIIKIEEPSSE
ncbi:MAG: hypothetical protein KJ957_07810 [Candidatus Omnitrophica bacterium]|nr:hypothetical protein [Candidatus Omnitrophota bacterium]